MADSLIESLPASSGIRMMPHSVPVNEHGESMRQSVSVLASIERGLYRCRMFEDAAHD